MPCGQAPENKLRYDLVPAVGHAATADCEIQDSAFAHEISVTVLDLVKGDLGYLGIELIVAGAVKETGSEARFANFDDKSLPVLQHGARFVMHQRTEHRADAADNSIELGA